MSVPTAEVSATSPELPRARRAARGMRLRPLLSIVSGVAVALAFPPFDQTWLMPVGIAGLMVAVRQLRGRGGFLHGLLFGLGFMLPLMRWITVIGPDAWVALGLLEAFFYALMGVAWPWLRPHRGWPI